MSYISFYGNGETAGSISKLQKGETAGSVGYDQVAQNSSRVTVPANTLTEDTVSFRGRDGKENPSFVKTLLKLGVTAAIVIGGLGYAHKAGWTSKLSEGKLKKGLDSITGKCHDWCHTVKEFGTKQYDKIKNFFKKKT